MTQYPYFQSETLIPESYNAVIVTDPVTLEPSVVVLTLLPDITTSPFLTSTANDDIRYQGQLFDCEYLNKTFYIGGLVGDTTQVLQVTENLVNWTSSYAVSGSVTNWPITRLAASDNTMVGLSVGGTLQGPVYSYDGFSWFSSSMDHASLANSVCWSPALNRFVAVGDKSTAWYSDDGLYWRIATSSRVQVISVVTDNNACVWNSVIWDDNNSRFIAVGERDTSLSFSSTGNTGSMMTSTDGITWDITTTVYTGSTGFRKVVNGDNTLVAITSNNILHTSTNGGDSWTKVTLSNANTVYDIAYSPSLNKFYMPYLSGSLTATSSFFTSSNGINWGTYTNELPNITVSPLNRIAWSSGSNKFIASTGVEGSLYVSDTDGKNFRTFKRSKTAWGYFIETPNNTIYDTALLSTTESFYNALIPGDGFTWAEFDLALGVGTPFDGPLTYYTGTSSLGIIIDSASLASFNFSDMYEVEDIEIGNIRYLRELDGVSEDVHYGYYETQTALPISASSKSTFSASLKSAGRDYAVVYYGTYGTSPNGTVAMILNLNSGIIEYQEDVSNANAENSFGLTNGNLQFETGPTLTSKANDYWELAFKVGFSLTGSSFFSGIYRTDDTLTLASSTSTPPATASLTVPLERTYVEQADAIITSPRPDYWWRADSGLSTSGWTAVSGSLDFTFMDVTTANSTVGAYFSQSWGFTQTLPADLQVKHIFIRLDDIRPTRYLSIPMVQDAVDVGVILSATGSEANGSEGLLTTDYYRYFERNPNTSEGTLAKKFDIGNRSGSGYWQNDIQGYSTGSKLLYTDFSEYAKTKRPAPAGYVDDWSPVSGSPYNGASFDFYVPNYKYYFLWGSGSRITIGKGPPAFISQYYSTYMHMYVKELAIFTSSLTIGEASAFSQEMLTRWP